MARTCYYGRHRAGRAASRVGHGAQHRGASTLTLTLPLALTLTLTLCAVHWGDAMHMRIADADGVTQSHERVVDTMQGRFLVSLHAAATPL